MDEGFAAEQASEYTGTYFSALAGSTDTGLTAEEVLLQSRQVNMQARNLFFKCQPENSWLEVLLQSRQVSMQAHTSLQVSEDLRFEVLLQSRRASMQARTSLHWQGQQTQGSQQGRFYCKADRCMQARNSL